MHLNQAYLVLKIPPPTKVLPSPVSVQANIAAQFISVSLWHQLRNGSRKVGEIPLIPMKYRGIPRTVPDSVRPRAPPDPGFSEVRGVCGVGQ